MSGNGLGVGGSMRRSSSQSQKMEMSKLQARMSSPFPPPHKTQLPPRYQVNPGTSWRSSCRRNVWIALSILLLLTLCSYLFSNVTKGMLMPSGHVSRGKGYVIIIDAGSTGSRLHVFQYENKAPGQDPNVSLPLINTKESPSLKVRPGLSSFTSDQAQAGKSLEPLLEFARKSVPESDRGITRLYLMATAGLRLLTKDSQDGILDSCRTLLRTSGFSFRNDWASVITGTEEGIYAWIAANYALGTLGRDPHETTGIVELGGASAQVQLYSEKQMVSLRTQFSGNMLLYYHDMQFIGSTQVTFVPKEIPPPAFRHDLSLLGVAYSLYTYSFLQFGQEAAWEAMLDSILNGELKPFVPALEKGVVFDPCTPRGYVQRKTSLVVHEDSSGSPRETVVSIHSAGNFTACRIAALRLLQKGSESCLYKKCAIGRAFVPELRGSFFATENFFYTSKFFGLPSSTSLEAVEAAGLHYCGEDWKVLQEKHKGMETDDLLKYCFSTAYIVALLHDTLGVDMNDDRIRFTNHVGDVPLDWALGALIFHMEREHFGEVPPPAWLLGDEAFRIFSVLGCIVLVGLAVWLVKRYRRPHLKTIYDLEKGRYITTAARSHR